MGGSCRCWRCQASRWSRACSRPAWRALRMASPRPSCSSLGVTYPTPAWSRTALYFARVAASSARSVAGSRIASRCGYSALTCPLRLSIQAWSVGVCGRPKCWAIAHRARNSRVAPEVICGPLSETASRIYDTTHFPAAGMAVLIIEDLVSRKRLTEVVSVEETSTQVELGFTAALQAEGLLARVEARHDDGRVDLTVEDETRPILLAVSDNGPQMTSGSTREFLALCAIAQHFGRPHTPTDQAWIESLNGHVKAEYPHLLAIRDPATLRAELAATRAKYNAVRLHAGVGYVTPNDEHEGRGEAIRKARQAGLEQARLHRLAWHRQHRQDRPIQEPHDVG